MSPFPYRFTKGKYVLVDKDGNEISDPWKIDIDFNEGNWHSIHQLGGTPGGGGEEKGTISLLTDNHHLYMYLELTWTVGDRPDNHKLMRLVLDHRTLKAEGFLYEQATGRYKVELDTLIPQSDGPGT